MPRIPAKTAFSDCFFVFLFDIQKYCPIFVASHKGPNEICIINTYTL